MNKIIPFYIDINFDSLYFENLKYKSKEECYRSKMKILNENNSLQDILIQTDEVILNDIILNSNNEYFLKAGIITDKLYNFFFKVENIVKNTVYKNQVNGLILCLQKI